MTSPPDQPGLPEHKVLSIFLNDFTDSDNEAAGLAWAWSLDRHPERKGIYIAEPRHVNLGYYMTSAEFGKCIRLVSRLEPRLESGDPALTTVLAGRMTREIINTRKVEGRPLNEDERKLVSYPAERTAPACCDDDTVD